MRSVFIIDDNAGILSEIRVLLEAAGFHANIFQDPSDFLDVALPVTPFVVLLDMRMPVTSGLGVQAALRQRGLPAPIIFMSGESEPSEIICAMRDRNTEFLLKPFSKTTLLSAIDSAFSKDAKERKSRSISSERERLEAIIKNSVDRLSDREKQLFQLIAEGYSNREIGLSLSMKTDTVKKHRTSVYKKFGVSSFADLLKLLYPIETPLP